MTLKDYKFNSKEDFIYYLRSLIILTFKNLETYDKQINQLGELIEEKNVIERPKRLVSANIYKNYRNMLGYTSNYLANLFGDTAEYGSSYQNYRRFIKKKSKQLNLDYLEFSQEQDAELNEITSARNWGSHVPVSLMNSTEDRVYEVEIDTNKPIYVADFEKYEGMWLINLYDESARNLKGYKVLFEMMKEEYSVLTGHPCFVIKQDYPVRDMSDLIIPKISSGIQKKRIKTVEDIKKLYEEESELA
ncbi:hypothetical protein [Sutcliffiella deserti]|uniref:hypothetical protein n=1 Tax=Sutcliffiella deserti TaxID=2875501 RepID=UPI001CBD2EBC|nr:hypothetical protein [Sutcliffiella deserti]